ncbi:MAG: hypothetical protein MPJ04_02075 [Nitrosopumilus sp.]|nr:hypothetical protein [Nitrosopumilus sp.]MDA7944800.1 hypothetical protein [Nitrosopumilus sp.]MDA7954628.1 hypothetical protein [Nitrosopumilus sp.]MDA7973701.1 hypothetical protein [Nitrosopumilus sp.]MDA7997357.1 hypothetical protein [Nitrosopumilus sp.]
MLKTSSPYAVQDLPNPSPDISVPSSRISLACFLAWLDLRVAILTLSGSPAE